MLYTGTAPCRLTDSKQLPLGPFHTSCLPCFHTRTPVSATDHARTSWTRRSLSVGRMASNEKLLLVALLAKKQRKRRSAERKVHVHPILSSRMYTGVHHSLFPDLCADEKKFFNYFRMSKPSFEAPPSYTKLRVQCLQWSSSFIYKVTCSVSPVKLLLHMQSYVSCSSSN